MADRLLPGAFWFDDIDAGGAPLLDLELDVSILDTFENNVQEDTGGSQGKSCDAAPKRKKRGRKPLSEQERQQRAEKEREANRLQQARYRQRQKAKQGEVASQHAAAAAELERERQRRSSLLTLNAVLERVLSLRSESEEVLRKAKEEERLAEGEPKGAGGAREMNVRDYLRQMSGGVEPKQRAQQLLKGRDTAVWHFLAERYVQQAQQGKQTVAALLGGGVKGVGRGQVTSTPAGSPRGCMEDIDSGWDGSSRGSGSECGGGGELGSDGTSGWISAWDSVHSVSGKSAIDVWEAAREGDSGSGSGSGNEEGEGPVPGEHALSMPTAAHAAGTARGGALGSPRPPVDPSTDSPPGTLLGSKWASALPTCMLPLSFHVGGTPEQGLDTDLRPVLAAAETDRDLIQEIESCSTEDYLRSWQTFSQAMRDTVTEYELTHSPLVLMKLHPLLKTQAILMTLLLKHNPQCVRSLFASSASHGRSEAQERAKWDAVVATLQLTPQQRERYIYLGEVYHHTSRQLRAQKHQAVELMHQQSSGSLDASDVSAAAEVAGGDTSDGEGLASCWGGLGGMMSRYLQALEAAQKLSSYPDLEFKAVLELMSDTGKIFTPLQKAKVLAAAHPLFPDILQVMEAVKRIEGNPGRPSES